MREGLSTSRLARTRNMRGDTGEPSDSAGEERLMSEVTERLEQMMENRPVGRPHRFSCPACEDTGIVLLERRLEDHTLGYAYRCDCGYGDGYPKLPLAPRQYEDRY